MNTFLWIIFILLIAFGLIYIGGMLALTIVIWCYAEDPIFWNNRIQPILTDVRDWVDAGNRLKDYPMNRIKDLKDKS